MTKLVFLVEYTSLARWNSIFRTKKINFCIIIVLKIYIGPKQELARSNINLKNVNLLTNINELDKNILVKVRSTGKLLDAKVDIKDNENVKVNLLKPEYGISPGQACVFYKKDQFGHKVLGGGWIKD